MKRRGFTLVEILICVIITFIVVGAIGLTLRMGIRLFEKTETNSVITNAMRLTIDSYNKKVVPFLSHAEEVEILEDNSKLPEKLPSSYDHYLYLEDGSLKLWNINSREALPGSEYITSLDFSMTDTSKDIYEKYVVSMDITARHPSDASAQVSLSVATSLYNKAKLIKKGTYGKVLHFVVKDTVLQGDNLRILDSSNNNLNEKLIVKGTVPIFYASYDLTPTPAYQYEDNSQIFWYISGADNKSPTSGDLSLEAVSDDNIKDHCWQIVDSSGNAISGDKLETDKEFYVKTKAGSARFGNYGFVRFMLVPAIKNKESGEDVMGENIASKFVKIVAKEVDEDSLWDLWATVNNMKTSEADGFFNNADVKEFSVAVDRESGNSYAVLNGLTSRVDAPSVVLAQLSPKYLKKQKRESLESGKSYTTLTNYSIIVDAKIGDGDGIGVLLSGAGKYGSEETDKIGDTGLMFQIAARTDTLPMRLYANGYQHNNAEYRSWGTGDHGKATIAPSGGKNEAKKTIAYTSDPHWHKFTGHGKTSKGSNFYGPFYGPGYMKNDVMQYLNDYYDYKDTVSGDVPKKMTGNVIDLVEPYTERMRLLITVLEYYTSDAKVPYFIVRVKFLKTEDELKKDDDTGDPFKTGSDWYKSEPIWYGGFAGAQPEKITSGDKTFYRFHVKNHGGYNGASFDVAEAALKEKLVTSASDPLSGNFYITKVSTGAKDGEGTVIETVFEAADINIGKEITENSFSNNTKKNNAAKLYEAPVRDRHLGLRIWSNKANYVTTIYSVNLAPGFSGQELRAIMPKGAKMYEVDNSANGTNEANMTGGTVTDVDQSNLNSIFSSGSSDGNGNGLYTSNDKYLKGVMHIQHTK